MNPFFIGILWTISLFGLASNCWSAYKIWKNFNLSFALYLVLFVSSAFTSLCLFVSNLGLLIHLLDPEFQGVFQCHMMSSPAFMAYFSGGLSLCVVSVMRHKIVRSNNQVNPTYTSIAILVTSFVYVPLVLWILELLQATTMPFLVYCKYGTKSSRPSLILQLFLAIPNISFNCLPFIFDLKTYRFIHSNTFPSKKPPEVGANANVNQSVKAQKMLGLELDQENELLQVPLKATLLSAGIALPSVLLYLTVWQFVDLKHFKVFATGILAFTLTSLRMPIVAFLVFQQNEINKRAISKHELREKRRQVEISHAKMRRRKPTCQLTIEDIEQESKFPDKSEDPTRPSSTTLRASSSILSHTTCIPLETQVEVH